MALNGPERVAGQCLLLGVEQTCRTGGSRSQFDPTKTTTDLRIGATEHRSVGVVQKSTFANFLASLDFRLFDSIDPDGDIGSLKASSAETESTTWHKLSRV